MSSGRTVFRRRVRWLLVAFLIGGSLVPLSGIFVTETEAPPEAGQRGICSLVLAALLALAPRVSRLAVILDDEGVLVRNIFRDIRLSWAEITGVEPPQVYGTYRKTGVRFHKTDGRLVSAAAFARGPLDNIGVGLDVVEAVRERLLGKGR